MTSSQLTETLKREAIRLGFDLVGVCPAVAPPGVQRLNEWLAAGLAGEMSYLGDRATAYAHPRHVLDGVSSILMLGINYRSVAPSATIGGQGRVSRYAWGSDYHDLIHARLGELVKLHRSLSPAAVRGVVDTAPLLEREFAQLAGLGWIGKNTLLLNRRLGSWFFLAALLTGEQLKHDEPSDAGHCGTCRACLDACPTGALVDAYRLDARRCISYLTIELRGAIPPELRWQTGDWLLGCDACQDVCPWNRRGPTTEEDDFKPRQEMNPVDLAGLFDLDDSAFRRRFKGTPLWRAKRRGLLRNAAVVLGNRPEQSALAALIRGLNDPEPLVRGAAAWALGQYGTPSTAAALQNRLDVEHDSEVRSEIKTAIAVCG